MEEKTPNCIEKIVRPFSNKGMLHFRSVLSKVLIATFLIPFSPSISGASVMGDLASQMSPGTWAELPTIGINQGHFFETAEVGKAVTQWSHKAAWDPNTSQWLFVGAPHYNPYKMVIYSEQSNTWREGPLPEPCMGLDPRNSNAVNPCIGHSFDHNTIDVSRGDLYYRSFDSGKPFKYSIVGNTWTPLPLPPQNGFQVTGVFQYFPELGGLLFADAQGFPASLYFMDPTTEVWSVLDSNIDMGPHSNISGYSSVHKVVIFGAGSNDSRSLYKIDATGTVTKLQNTPFNLRVGNTVFTPDPISGNFVVVQWDSNTQAGGFYEYDVVNDAWTLLDPNPPVSAFGGPVGDLVAAPISNHGVIMYLKYYFDQTKVFLYKHQQGTGTPVIPDTVSPSIPTALQGSPTSATEVYLQWNPSTDDRGVAGYKIFRNGSEISSTSSASYFNSNIAAPGFYNYAVSAFDAAGNQSSLSTQVTVNVQGNTSSGSDFNARCSDINVIRCFSFDSQAETDPHVAAPWRFRNTGQKLGFVDTSIKSSGAGSLRFDIPTNSESDTSGSFSLNFSDDLSTQFGEGEDFYIQWRQRFSPELLETLYLISPISSGNLAYGWKQAIIGEGDRPGDYAESCTPSEIVVQNSLQFRKPAMYHSCGSKDGRYEGLETPLNGGSDFDLQPGPDVDGCLYSLQFQNPGVPVNQKYIPPYGPCMGYKANQWMTFQVHVHVGTWYLNDGNYHQDSQIELWVAHEGQPSKKVIERLDYDLVNCAAGDTACLSNPDVKYGKIWLLPYHSFKSPDQAHALAQTWYDDLIISRAKIPDPQISSDQFPPAPPQNLKVTQ